MPQSRNRGTSSQAAPITDRLSSTGVAAGTAKRFQVLRMPADSATSDMQRDVGEHQPRHHHRGVELGQARGHQPDHGRRERPRRARWSAPGPRTAPWRRRRSAGASRRRLRALRVRARIGTKACENAPSANRRRSRLGMRNATLKASVQALAPKLAATSSSRASPVTREASVSRETVEAARSRFIGWPAAGRERIDGKRAIIGSARRLRSPTWRPCRGSASCYTFAASLHLNLYPAWPPRPKPRRRPSASRRA